MSDDGAKLQISYDASATACCWRGVCRSYHALRRCLAGKSGRAQRRHNTGGGRGARRHRIHIHSGRSSARRRAIVFTTAHVGTGICTKVFTCPGIGRRLDIGRGSSSGVGCGQCLRSRVGRRLRLWLRICDLGQRSASVWWHQADL
jgi:hypothetical protein